MTKRQRNACELFAADARKSLDKGSLSVDISAFNYGLSPSDAVLAELRTMLPGVDVDSYGVMGYVHFTKKKEESHG